MDRETGPKGHGKDGDGEALAAAQAAGRAGRDKADTYLDEATKLARLRIEQLEEERRFEPFSHFSAVMKAAFESAVALVILAILAGAGAMVWSAATDSSLVIEPFSVPADMAAEGLNGQVVAALLQDRLAALQQRTRSMRAADSYQNNWGDEIKVQIPETGVSLGELNRYLHRWLGHQTRISGEVYDDGGKLTVAARVGNQPARRFTGMNGKLDALVQKAAEAVYAKTQPYRYAVYLQYSHRGKKAEAAYRALIASGPARERAWAYVGLGTLVQSRGDIDKARHYFDAALKIRPNFILALIDKGGIEDQLQHLEAAYQIAKTLDRVAARGTETDIDPTAMPTTILGNRVSLAIESGDYRHALDLGRKIVAMPDYNGSIANALRNDLGAYAYLHDRAGVNHTLAALPPTNNAQEQMNRDAVHLVAEALLGNWQAALDLAPSVNKQMHKVLGISTPFSERVIPSLTAYALAMTGHRKEAAAMIAPLPADCDTCTRTRIRIAMAARDWKAAEHWARHLIARTPSLPFGHGDLGRVLLAKGDASGAAREFEIAHRKSPHYADALEGWGQALMAQNRSDLALAKFAAADKDAPNWGRLHLKWGEALAYTGDTAKAQKQFDIAAKLYLTADEQAALAKWRQQS